MNKECVYKGWVQTSCLFMYFVCNASSSFNSLLFSLIFSLWIKPTDVIRNLIVYHGWSEPEKSTFQSLHLLPGLKQLSAVLLLQSHFFQKQDWWLSVAILTMTILLTCNLLLHSWRPDESRSINVKKKISWLHV